MLKPGRSLANQDGAITLISTMMPVDLPSGLPNASCNHCSTHHTPRKGGLLNRVASFGK